mmetsp:Transcript_9947/g.26375  ORF Transcript_9947/g.26375 Transcript_9947/m.26375 type:complete len:116 (-) Transcript_9947:1132-1479(-)
MMGILASVYDTDQVVALELMRKALTPDLYTQHRFSAEGDAVKHCRLIRQQNRRGESQREHDGSQSLTDTATQSWKAFRVCCSYAKRGGLALLSRQYAKKTLFAFSTRTDLVMAVK